MTASINWQDLNPELFLRNYWQKKPLIIKGAFTHFKDPVDANELAGLAMEEFIESRIVNKSNSTWNVEHGPFKDFNDLGSNNWTLLVQAVNHWFNDVNDLMIPFNFIPTWRIDDVMVSFSTPGGGVGPHLDQYDVFIIQGEGKRHWRVGLPDSNLQDVLPHEDLKQVSPFTAVIDEITEPGDLLYIPPNHPHDGIAIENSLNYSIGFQAPNAQELLSSFADYMVDNNLFTNRLEDSGRTVCTTPSQLTEEDVTLLVAEMHKGLQNRAAIEDFLGKYLTSVHHSLNLLVPVTPLKDEFVEEVLISGESLEPVLGLKVILISPSQINNLHDRNDKTSLFINGERFIIESDTIGLAQLLAKRITLTHANLKSSLHCLKNKQLLTSVINKGYWCFE